MPLGYDPMNMPCGMLCLGEVLGSVADLREAQSSIPSLLEKEDSQLGILAL